MLLARSMALSYKSSSSLSTSGGAGDGDCGANKTLSGGGWSGEPGWNFGRGPSQPDGGAVGEAGGCCLGGELAGLGGAVLPTASFIRRQKGRGTTGQLHKNQCHLTSFILVRRRKHTRPVCPWGRLNLK